MSKPIIMLDLLGDLERTFLDQELLDRLAGLGEVTRSQSSAGPGDPRLQADVVVTGWGSPALPQRLSPDDRLRLVSHSAGTIRFFVPKSLIEDGVHVTQAAAGMAISVAEHALSFTLSLLRNSQQVERYMARDHDWRSAASVEVGHTVSGTRIGVLGASRVGRAYIRMVVALGAEVVVYDPYLTAEDAKNLGVAHAGLDELLSTCPVIANHAPVTQETRGLLNSEKLSLIQDGGILINTARSAIIDTAALVDELQSGRISAGLDVFDREPLESGSPLWGLPNVILTPHIGGITLEARRDMGRIAVDEVENFLTGRPLTNEILAPNYDILA